MKRMQDRVRWAFVAVMTLFFSTTAAASGGVHCKKISQSLPPVSFSWGVGHVEGGGRISPYRLTLSGRDVLISDGRDAAPVEQGTIAERVTLHEVGYWNGPDRISVWLADEQVSRPALLLQAVKAAKGDDYEGTLTIKDVKGLSIANVPVVCTTE